MKGGSNGCWRMESIKIHEAAKKRFNAKTQRNKERRKGLQAKRFASLR
jgi:hypothetical protein